jgi:hypothetical protein
MLTSTIGAWVLDPVSYCEIYPTLPRSSLPNTQSYPPPPDASYPLDTCHPKVLIISGGRQQHPRLEPLWTTIRRLSVTNRQLSDPTRPYPRLHRDSDVQRPPRDRRSTRSVAGGSCVSVSISKPTCILPAAGSRSGCGFHAAAVCSVTVQGKRKGKK